jgi:hypothetical protein
MNRIFCARNLRDIQHRFKKSWFSICKTNPLSLLHPKAQRKIGFYLAELIER